MFYLVNQPANADFYPYIAAGKCGRTLYRTGRAREQTTIVHVGMAGYEKMNYDRAIETQVTLYIVRACFT